MFTEDNLTLILLFVLVMIPLEVANVDQIYNERRIMLIGKSGTGKSTLGNAILGYKCFETKGCPMSSITTQCKVGQMQSMDRKKIVVLDTPGLKSTTQESHKIKEELCKCTAMMAPGPHVFCLVIEGNAQFRQEDKDTLNEFCEFFGEDIYKYVIVVFTHKARMGKGSTSDDCFYALPSEFISKFLAVGGKKIAIVCKAKNKELKKHTYELLKLIEETIERNDSGYYSEQTFKVAEESFRKRISTCQQEVEKQLEMKRKSLENEYQERAKWFGERANELAKKLQEEKEKVKQEKQSKEKHKRGKVALAAQIRRLKAKHGKQIESLEAKLEKERNEKEKIKEECNQKIEDINREVRRCLFATINVDRTRGIENVSENQSFIEMARNAVMEGAGCVYDTAVGLVGNYLFAARS